MKNSVDQPGNRKIVFHLHLFVFRFKMSMRFHEMIDFIEKSEKKQNRSKLKSRKRSWFQSLISFLPKKFNHDTPKLSSRVSESSIKNVIIIFN